MSAHKLNVVLICSFSNAKVREHIPFSKRRLYNLGRRIFGLPASNGVQGDVAGWDTYMIELLRQRDDIDLHVISAHSGMSRSLVSFQMDGVDYHFVRSELANLLKHLIPSAALWHSLNPMRPVVKRLIQKIHPDIVALVGAENPHIAGTVLGIKDIPLIVKCQTVYNNPARGKFGEVNEKNAYVERLIFRDLRYVAVGTAMHSRLFRTFNTSAYNFKWSLGNLLPEVKSLPKEYDFVNFAMSMSDKKGFSDAIEALALVKKKYPQVMLNLTGSVPTDYRVRLQQLINDRNLNGNVVFTPFFERQEDLFQHLQRSRFALLPCKMDSVSSTIRQAMHYGLPVVCYKTEGTPRLNNETDCVLIAENGNTADLAEKMLLLLDDKFLADSLRENAKNYSARWNNDKANSQQMSDNFHAVVDNYTHGTPIPEDLLYNENT